MHIVVIHGMTSIHDRYIELTCCIQSKYALTEFRMDVKNIRLPFLQEF